MVTVKLWEQALIAGFILYLLIGGIYLACVATKFYFQEPSKNWDKYKVEYFFVTIFMFWPIVVFWTLQERCQRKRYQRLKAKFEGK